ncbi:ABC transporter ATP-binding protein [Leifsonia sp. TF02-11]|uniref:ABC transporter ATP-binding protein n=1 Tax=Leifsonia sp. TF02-11 TaxID=2815212 RepID=UPI001AA11C23|nr:ABC transporter ATP-binding protein [Leifsonia sp. TF02-11]MBO1737399.1 ABC transporter ATP-binding protein [Leifsonia sp. TF02-11]
MTATAVDVHEVSKKFRLYHERNQSLKSAIMRGRRSVHEDFWALKDVSFEVPEGSTFGLIGSNGSGKSTLLKCLARIYTPEKGTITARGKLAALLEVGSGFHPELSGRENVFLNGSILGMSRKEITRKFDEIVEFSGVEQFIDQPVKNYSSGMYVRLGFSVAINVEPEILVVDEVLAVGDADFQEKCRQKFVEFKQQGRTVILVSHAMGQVKDMCDHAAWLSHGELVSVGEAGPTIDAYLASLSHPS